jgi:hypothetical protein
MTRPGLVYAWIEDQPRRFDFDAMRSAGSIGAPIRSSGWTEFERNSAAALPESSSLRPAAIGHSETLGWPRQSTQSDRRQRLTPSAEADHQSHVGQTRDSSRHCPRDRSHSQCGSGDGPLPKVARCWPHAFQDIETSALDSPMEFLVTTHFPTSVSYASHALPCVLLAGLGRGIEMRLEPGDTCEPGPGWRAAATPSI